MPSITGLNVGFYINYGGVPAPCIILQDTTDYMTQGIADRNDLNGNLKVTSPSGVVIHDNTDFSDGGCDMPGANFSSESNVILPLMSNGVVQPGVYVIDYKVLNKITSDYYTFQRSISFTYIKPTLDVDVTVDYDLDLFTSDDKTVYVVDGITPVISSYAHNLYYPHGSAGDGSPILTGDLIIKTSTFYPGTQSTTVRATCVWTYDSTAGNTFDVLDTVSGTIDTVVSTNDLCSYYCCLRKLNTKIENARCHNHKSLQSLLDQAAQVSLLINLISVAKTCGHTNDIPEYLSQIKSVLGCSDGCDDCN